MKTKQTLLALGLAVLLTACSSGVKLNDVPVEDRNPSRVTPPPTTSMPDQTRVAPVSADNIGSGQTGPASVARLVYFYYDSYVIKS